MVLRSTRARARAAVGAGVAVSLLPLLAMTAQPAAAEVPNGYVLVDLTTGGGAGGPNTAAHDLSDAGRSVGGMLIVTTIVPPPTVQAFSRTTSGPIVDLDPANNRVSTAYAAEGAWTAGDAFVPVGGEMPTSVSQAFRTDGTTFTPLGSLGFGQPSHADDVSATGTVVGWANNGGVRTPAVASGPELEELLYTEFSSLPGEATGISAAGEIVGWTSNGAPGTAQAFLTTLAERLPTPIPGLSGKTDVKPYAISDNGRWVVGSYLGAVGPFGQEQLTGFRLDRTTGVVEDAPMFAGAGAAVAVNDAGTTIINNPGGQWVWTADGDLENFGLATVNDNGWRIDRVNGINNSGQIVGVATKSNMARPVRFDPTDQIADVAAAVVANPNPVTVNQSTTVTVTTSNHGNGTAYGTFLTLYLLEFTNGTTGTVGTLPAGCTGNQNGGIGYVIQCFGPDVAPSGSATTSIPVTYKVTGPHEVSASLQSSSPDSNFGNDFAETTVQVNQPQITIKLIQPTIELVQKTVAALGRLLLPRPPTTPA